MPLLLHLCTSFCKSLMSIIRNPAIIKFVKDVKTQWRFVVFSFLYWNFSIRRTENRSFSRHFAKLKLSCLYLVSDKKEALKPKWTSSTLPRPSSSVIWGERQSIAMAANGVDAMWFLPSIHCFSWWSVGLRIGRSLAQFLGQRSLV